MFFQKNLKKSKIMKEAEQVIKYALLLNSENLSVLRSGNISIRYKNGFLITPSGVKYSSLKSEDSLCFT